VDAFAVFDDGTGPALYAAGIFAFAGGVPASSIAKWDGSGWSPLGGGLTGTAYALAVYDDGTGPALYAGGEFTQAGGLPAMNLARWDGTNWSSLGGILDNDVLALTTFDDGSGPALYIGGAFRTAGGISAPSFVRWNGTAWTSIGGGTDGSVDALAVFDDGSGPGLYAGGSFFHAGGVLANSVARWNGATWQPLGSGIGGYSESVRSLAVFDDGTGPALYVGGEFSEGQQAPGNGIARWNGAGWSSLGTGMSNSDPQAWVAAMTVFDPGSGPSLYVGGRFQHAGSSAAFHLARWQGGTWSSLSDGSSAGITGPVDALATFDDGAGPSLYAAGTFDLAGVTPAASVAKWNGASWSALGGGLVPDVIYALQAFDDGTGPALYVGGRNLPLNGHATGHIVRWNGTAWSTLGNGVSGFQNETNVTAFAVYSDANGPGLYVGGHFTHASNVYSSSVIRWDSSGWRSVGGGFDGDVLCLAVYDDGSGPALIAGGFFSGPGNNVAKWNGSTWSPLGPGLALPGESVEALAALEEGNQHVLYAAGTFTSGGGVTMNHVARWNGSSWSPVGLGLCDVVRALKVFDDGGGPALYAGGEFNCSGTTPLSRIAKWNGTTWTSLGGGLDWTVRALADFDDGSGVGPGLFAGGEFSTAGSIASTCIAEWKSCPTSPGIPFCFGDGTSGACPCANNGSAGHGCQNSAATGGALLGSSGSTSPDSVVLLVSGEMPSALTIFAQGSASIAPVHFGDGLRCAGGNLKRLYSKNAVGGAAAAPQSPEPSISLRSSALGDPLYPGTTRYYFTYYRDPNPTFCPPPSGDTFNSSNELRITW
jgi:hypothetical protein